MSALHGHTVGFGPRLVASATGRLKAALLVRPSRAIETAIPLIGEPGAIYERALEQFDVLRKTLEYFGVETTVVEPHGSDPLGSNAGDTAVVFEDGAALMRLTPLARRAEVDRIEAEFGRLDVPLAGHVAAPGLLDGNDVVLAGGTAFVGAGTRGNELGRSGFARLAQAHGYRVVEVPLSEGVPALRAVAGAVAHDAVVIGADKVDVSAFAGFRTIRLERGEEQGAGVLVLSECHVIADLRYRTALSTMRRAGVTVESLDLYEFTKLGITPSMLVLALRRE
jgi:N-dimethylarginine dimethylaminohydrolase